MRETAGGGGGADRSAQPKTRTPHKDVGKKASTGSAGPPASFDFQPLHSHPPGHDCTDCIGRENCVFAHTIR